MLDLVLTTCPELCSEVTYMPKISEHSLVNFAVTIPVLKFSNRTKVLRNYRNADFKGKRSAVISFPYPFNQINYELFLFLQTFQNEFEERAVECNWMLLKTKMTELANRFISVRVIGYNPQAPWYKSFIRPLANKKKKKKTQSNNNKNACIDAQKRLATNIDDLYVVPRLMNPILLSNQRSQIFLPIRYRICCLIIQENFGM
ncbi:unnamed protein product [Ixodes persulcatus]